ncbi:MAG: hypothetical protein K8R02_05970 [Anaerohalosphaeraceae bacterium]|nr:hypothetical protein [Anaerohalosphaeraceae bacterium]
MMSKKNNAIIIIIIIAIMAVSSFGRDIRDYLPASWDPNDDLRSYIQDAFDNETSIEFTGSGDYGNPTIYPSTAGLVIRENSVVQIEADAQLKRLPSNGTFLTLEDGVQLTCPAWGTLKAKIDGNKWAHWPAYPDLGKIYGPTIKMDNNCYLSKIHVFSSPGHAFMTWKDDNYVINCKAEDVGYIDVKYGEYVYQGSTSDASSGDGFYFRGDGNQGKNLVGVDCQRWDFCASHTGSLNTVYEDCVGSDINFDGFGLYDDEISDGNNTAIRVSVGSDSTNNPESEVMSIIDCAGHLVDCNLREGKFYFFWNIDGSTLSGGTAREIVIGRYGSSGTLAISGEVDLSEDIMIHGGEVLTLHQTGGTITVGRDIIDSQHNPLGDDPNRFYIITQTGGLLDVANDVHIGNTAGSIGTHNLAGGNLKMSGTGSDPLLVYGGSGQGNLNISDGSAITEETGAAVPMVIRWYDVAEGTLQGYGTVGLTGWFVNNGKVIADGNDVERTLDMTSFSSANNNFSANGTGDDGAPQDIENTTDNGWYAINKGELALPAISVSAGNTSVNWGERPSDSSIDLVNSARVSFSNADSGQLDISLLANDRADTQGGAFIGVWEVDFDGNFDSAVLTFRYDPNAANELGLSENDIRVYHRAGGSPDWVDVTDTIDLANKRIVTTSVNSFSQFAVGGGIPENCGEPGTVYLEADWSGPEGVPDCYIDFFDFAALPEAESNDVNTVIYETGFEASGEAYGNFAAGAIDGQNGWAETNPETNIFVTTNSPFGSVNVLQIKKTGSSNPYSRKYFETDANVDRELVDVEHVAQVGASTMKGYLSLGNGWKTAARWGFAGSGEGTGNNFFVYDGGTVSEDIVYGTAHYSIWTTYKFVVSADAVAETWSLDVYDGSDVLVDSFSDLGFYHTQYWTDARFDCVTITRPTGADMIVDDLTITEHSSEGGGINFVALALLVEEWLYCTDPAETYCDMYWK